MSAMCILHPCATPYMQSAPFKKACVERMGFVGEPLDKFVFCNIKQLFSTCFSDIIQYVPAGVEKNSEDVKFIYANGYYIYDANSDYAKVVTQDFLDLLNSRHINHEPFYLIAPGDVFLMTKQKEACPKYVKYSLQHGREEGRNYGLDAMSKDVFKNNYGLLSLADCPVFFTTDRVVEYLRVK